MKLKPKIISIALAGTLALGTATTAGAVSSDRFNDVKATDWYYSAVNHVVDHNYFNGVGANTFAPNQSLNRAMAVTVLARMFGGDLSSWQRLRPASARCPLRCLLCQGRPVGGG